MNIIIKITLIVVGLLLTNQSCLFGQSYRNTFVQEKLEINNVFLTIDSALTVFKETDSIQVNEYSLAFKNKAFSTLDRDTLVLFSFGSEGYHGLGSGKYDSLTLKYGFIYIDVSLDCTPNEGLIDVVNNFNSTVKKEIGNRNNQNWKTNLKNEIDRIEELNRIKKGLKADVQIKLNKINYKNNDTISRDQLTICKIRILNQIAVLKKNKVVYVKMYFLDNLKPLTKSDKFKLGNKFNKKQCAFIDKNKNTGNRFYIELEGDYGFLGNISLFLK